MRVLCSLNVGATTAGNVPINVNAALQHNAVNCLLLPNASLCNFSCDHVTARLLSSVSLPRAIQGLGIRHVIQNRPEKYTK